MKFEFWLSAIIFIGGGALIWHDPSLMTQVFVLWGVLITFWFSRRQAETSSSNLLNVMQNTQPVLPPVQPVEQIPIVEQPAQPRAPEQKYIQPTEEKSNG